MKVERSERACPGDVYSINQDVHSNVLVLNLNKIAALAAEEEAQERAHKRKERKLSMQSIGHRC